MTAYGKGYGTEREAYDALDSFYAEGEISGADRPAIRKTGGKWRIYLGDDPRWSAAA